MNDRLNDRLRQWLQRGALPIILEVALLLALAVSLAHWTWTLFAPRAVAVSALGDPIRTGQTVPAVRRNLFGNAQVDKGMPGTDTASVSRIRLLGVLSRGAAGSGRAIFAVESGKPKTVEAGSAIAHGYVLKEVHADHVLVARDGTTERLRLDRRGAVKN